MATYSIKELEQISGIKAHTIRIWEQRHKILEPKRTPTNIRYYTDCDLKLLMRVALLNKQGFRISKIAQMTDEDLEDRCACMEHSKMKEEWQMAELTAAMIELDESRFEEVMVCGIRQDGFEKTMLETICPFLEKVGVMWIAGSVNPAQEHFISNLIRQKIIVEIDRIPSRPAPIRSLLFLPEGELHELGLLFLHYLLKVRGREVTYLGCSVPLDDVKEVVKIRRINEIYSIWTSAPARKTLADCLDEMNTAFKRQKVYLSGYQTRYIEGKQQGSVKIFKDMKHLIKLIESVKKL